MIWCHIHRLLPAVRFVDALVPGVDLRRVFPGRLGGVILADLPQPIPDLVLRLQAAGRRPLVVIQRVLRREARGVRRRYRIPRVPEVGLGLSGLRQGPGRWGRRPHEARRAQRRGVVVRIQREGDVRRCSVRNAQRHRLTDGDVSVVVGDVVGDISAVPAVAVVTSLFLESEIKAELEKESIGR